MMNKDTSTKIVKLKTSESGFLYWVGRDCSVGHVREVYGFISSFKVFLLYYECTM